MKRYPLLAALACMCTMLMFHHASAQVNYWQQKVEYQMNINMDVNTNQFTGTQKLTYHNNSPDTLTKVYYHLYFNAFQPGSMMDIRSLTIEDADPRVSDRIHYLKEDEIGYLKITSLKQDGKALNSETEETILTVTLAKLILPGGKAVFEMEFNGQVPLQIRRSGRDNAEGIEYSMAQWFPKMAEYDVDGWHPDPYIGREFYGVWGDFDVKIAIDSAYTVAASGILQNPQEIGHGYAKAEQKVKRPSGSKIIYHFKAENVHDFVWAADTDYTHTITQVPDGPELHFFYQTDTLAENWQRLPEFTVQAFQYMNKNFGKYPYAKYSVIQGGDGGMEYPMATLITGHRTMSSLIGVTVHELIHSWYQGVLATNESLYPWMDEGFTSYASNRVMASFFGEEGNPNTGSYAGYFALAKSGKEEPLITHADHYNTNQAYGLASYSKGAVFLDQLSYIVGQETFDKGMRRYFGEWKFKHPDASTFIRVMEKESDMILDWYLEYFVYTTRTIDYAVKSVEENGNHTDVLLERIGLMPMPQDVMVTYKDGSRELFYIPMQIMWGEKKNETDIKRTVLQDWPWVYPTYMMSIPKSVSQIKSIEIDSSKRMADTDRTNNVYPEAQGTTFEGKAVKR